MNQGSAPNYANSHCILHRLACSLKIKARFTYEWLWWNSTNDRFHYILTLEYLFRSILCDRMGSMQTSSGMSSSGGFIARKRTHAVVWVARWTIMEHFQLKNWWQAIVIQNWVFGRYCLENKWIYSRKTIDRVSHQWDFQRKLRFCKVPRNLTSSSYLKVFLGRLAVILIATN